MKIKSLLFALLLVNTAVAQDRFPQLGENDWGWWRGPLHNGVAPANTLPPVMWDDATNVKWKSEIPGRGHSSPIVVGDRVYLTSADETKLTQHVFCYSRSDGKLIWNTLMHQGDFDHNNKKNSFASGSVSCDGEKLYVSFFRDLKVITSALDLEGKKVWEHTFEGFRSHQGFGCSPLLYKDMAIIAMIIKEQEVGLSLRWLVKQGKRYGEPAVLSYRTTCLL